jgi:hypothetical protein
VYFLKMSCNTMVLWFPIFVLLFVDKWRPIFVDPNGLCIGRLHRSFTSIWRPWAKWHLPRAPSCRGQLPKPDFKKIIVLAFLNVIYQQIPYWVHFTFKVPNPIYMFTFIEQRSNWLGFHFQSETTNKPCN